MPNVACIVELQSRNYSARHLLVKRRTKHACENANMHTCCHLLSVQLRQTLLSLKTCQESWGKTSFKDDNKKSHNVSNDFYTNSMLCAASKWVV